MKKSEQLLHLIEHVDDSILEKALSVKSARRTARRTWLRLGNVAALFVGAVAVSLVVTIAFFLGGNGYEPNLGPDRIPGRVLLLPQVHSPTVSLPPGQRYITPANPWHTVGREIDVLPVFRSNAINLDPIPQALEDIPLNLNDDDMTVFRREVTRLAEGIAAATGIPANIGQGRQFSIMYTLELALVLTAEINMQLPAGASLAHDATDSQREAAIGYLMSRFADIIPMTAPTTLRNATRILRDFNYIGEPQSFEEHGHRIFDSSGTPEESILNFNFNWVEFIPSDTGGVAAIQIPLAPATHMEAFLEGYYPIITPEEARQMLLDGYFIPGLATSRWPGSAFAEAASVELVYITAAHNAMLMPVYRFLLGAPWFDMGGTGDIPHQVYYVPAVHRDFLEPMPRRFTDNMPLTPYDYDIVGWAVIHEGRLYFNEARLYVQDNNFQHRGENINVFGNEDDGEEARQKLYEYGFFEDYFFGVDPPGTSIPQYVDTDENGVEQVFPSGFVRQDSGYYRDDGTFGGGLWELRRRYYIFPSGHVTRRLENETVRVFDLTGNEEFILTDAALRFLQYDDMFRRYHTQDVNEFLEHLGAQNRLHCFHDPSLVMTPEEFLLRTCECRWRGVILFLRIQDGRLVTVTEEFRFTF